MVKCTEILIDTKISDEEAFSLELQWEKAENVDLIIPSKLDESDLVKLYKQWIRRIPSKLSFSVLATICERSEFPDHLLEDAFKRGGLSVKIGIVLRPNLPNQLWDQIRASTEEEVFEHWVFNSRVSIEECKYLLTTERGARIKDTLERAIQIKAAQL